MFGDLSILPIATLLISGGMFFMFTSLISLVIEPFKSEQKVSK